MDSHDLDTWLISMVNKSPKDRVIPLINGHKWGLLTTYKSWGDPPSIGPLKCALFFLET